MKYVKLSVYAISMALMFGGCAQKGSVIIPGDSCQPVKEECDEKLKKKDGEIDTLKKKNTALLAELDDCKGNCNQSLFPPNPKPGECYARLMYSAEYEETKEKVMVQPESTKLIKVPARYENVKERVVIQEESVKLVTVPATYKYVTEHIPVSSASSKIKTTPAKYKKVEEKILVNPAHEEWKRLTAEECKKLENCFIPEGQMITNATGEILCLIKVSDKYKTVIKRELIQEATTEEIDQPIKYKTIKRKVVDKPAYVKEVVIPAKYKTINVKTLVEEAHTKSVTVPARYEPITKKHKVKDARLAWATIICVSDATSDLIKELQRKLKRQGFYTGPIDGLIGPKTKQAVIKYQTKMNLPSGSLTRETLNSLKIKHIPSKFEK